MLQIILKNSTAEKMLKNPALFDGMYRIPAVDMLRRRNGAPEKADRLGQDTMGARRHGRH